MKKQTVSLKKPVMVPFTPVQDAEGNLIVDKSELQESATLSGIILPITSEMAIMKYGYKEPVAYQLFYKGNHPDLHQGNYIEYQGTDYIICHVADYIKVKVVLLSADVKGG